MAQILDDFLGNMRKVRPSGAIAPLQQDVTEMGRSINPMGKPKAVNLPALGSDRMGMPSGYGEEGTTERENTTVAQTSSVRGQMPKFDYPAYPDFNYPGMPEHTQYPDLPGEWQPPALPDKIDPNSLPPYPTFPEGGPLKDVVPYANIGRTALSLGVPTASLAGFPTVAKGLEAATHIVNPIVSGLNIYNAWGDPNQSKGQQIRTTIGESARSGPQLLMDFADVGHAAGIVSDSAQGWTAALGSAAQDYAPYVNTALSGYEALTSSGNKRGSAIMDTAMGGIGIATLAGGPYAGLFTAGAKLVQGGIQMYKSKRDERQPWTWSMHDTAIRADIKRALEYGGKVTVDDVIKRLTSLGLSEKEANEYLDKQNFYGDVRAKIQNGVWGGDWEDWRQNKQIIEDLGDMTGVEGGASVRDVIENKKGITTKERPKPIDHGETWWDEVNYMGSPAPTPQRGYDFMNYNYDMDNLLNPIIDATTL